MIPKKIHYCWFGRKPKPSLALRCIESWKKHCPDYEIIEWNEDNFNVEECAFCREAYDAQKWAFVTDYARLSVVYRFGGIYLDTDVEVIRNLDTLLDNDCFLGIEQSLQNFAVATGLGFGAVSGHRVLKDLIDEYKKRSFDLILCPEFDTPIIERHGYVRQNRTQNLEDIVIYSTEFFCPKDYESGKITLTDQTYTIHHFAASWVDERQKREFKKYKRRERRNLFIISIIGKKNYDRLKRMLHRE